MESSRHQMIYSFRFNPLPRRDEGERLRLRRRQVIPVSIRSLAETREKAANRRPHAHCVHVSIRSLAETREKGQFAAVVLATTNVSIRSLAETREKAYLHNAGRTPAPRFNPP